MNQNKPFILNRADPYVCRHTDGTYYFTASVPEYNRIILRKSSTIEGLASAEELVIWTAHESGPMSCHIWAPELHYLEDAWYLYFAAGDKNDIWKIRPYVLTCKGDPFVDSFTELGMMQAAEEDPFSFQDFSLDMTVFEYEGEHYCVWAEKVGVGKKISNLYIARMETPYRLKTAQVLLSSPDYPWERQDFWVNEGAAVLKKDGRIFLTYSASATGACYCMGMLALSEGGNPLNPAHWRKYQEPVLSTDGEKGLFGPGHNCFVKSQDGTKDIMIFHARQYEKIEGDPLYDENRHAFCMEVGWSQEGWPLFSFKKSPNILMIVADHQAFYGHSMVKTPCFDKLKNEGVFFENTYCTSPLCMPSRKSILTGLYPHNHGQTDNSYETSYEGVETYLDVLDRENYRSYYFGKWHAGEGSPKDFGCMGVSYPDYSNPYLQTEYDEYIERNGLNRAAMSVEKNMCEKGWIDDVNEGAIYSFPREMTNEALSGLLISQKESHEAFYVADMAKKQLEEIAHGEDRSPFMMRIDFWGPHQPYCPTKEFADLYPPESIEKYPSFDDDLSDKPESYKFDTGRVTSADKRLMIPNAMPWGEWQKLLSRCYGQITMVDEAAGGILEKLEELGLDKDTLVIWTADHGDAIACHGGHFDKAFYLPEEVMRIPLAMSYRGVLPKGEVCRKLITNADIAPTIAEAAGGKFAGGTDGMSILRLFKEPVKAWREAVFAETHGHLAPWKARMAVWKHYKYVENAGDMEELYDLDKDPYERSNLAGDDGYFQVLTQMRKVLGELKEIYNDR